MSNAIPADEYARQTKTLTATVNRLRGWVGTDDSKAPELANALVALTAHQLRGHAFREAAVETQESLNIAARLVASHGPLGPYTPKEDAVRLVTAAIQLAVVLTEAGQTEAAGQALATAENLVRTLARHGLDVDAGTEVHSWALIARCRIALADDQPGPANAAIDAAAQGTDFQELDRLTALAAARWAAGNQRDSIAAAWRAVEYHDSLTGNLLAVAARLAPARTARLSQPMSGLRGDLADRLMAVGDTETALMIRRQLIEALEPLAEVRGHLGAAELAAARRALADDLARVGRSYEAEELLSLPGVRMAAARSVLEPIGQAVDWSPLGSDEPFVTATTELSGDTLEDTAARAEAARTEAVRIEHEKANQAEQFRRQEAEAQARASAQREAEERREAEQRLRDQAAEADRAKAEQAAAVAESQRQRAQRLAAHEQAQREREAQLRDEAERAADPLVAARARLAACRTAGDRQGSYAAAQDVVAELRGRFTANPSAVNELIVALQELATAQRQAGDWWGSRRPAKEAKELTRRWLRR